VEINEGDALCRNLKAQKQAIVAWDVAELLVQINAREPWIRSLGELASRRCHIVGETYVFNEAATLRQTMAKIPNDSVEKTRFIALRERTRNTFVQLQEEGPHLHLLMENLLSHIQEVFAPVLQPASPTYGEMVSRKRRGPLPRFFTAKLSRV